MHNGVSAFFFSRTFALLPLLGMQSRLHFRSLAFHYGREVLVPRQSGRSADTAPRKRGLGSHRRFIGSSAEQRKFATLRDAEDAATAHQNTLDDKSFDAVCQHTIAATSPDG